MEPCAKPVTLERLNEVRAWPECIAYCENVPTGFKHAYRLSIYGIYTTGEIFVRMSDGNATRVRSFFSRHKDCPPKERRKGLPLVDVADAFTLARVMPQHWGRTTRAPVP